MAGSHGTSILVVDDSPMVLELAREALEAAGFEVTVVRDHLELRAAMTRAYDLILVDVMLPGIEGDELAYMIRTCRASKGRIHLFSALDREELEARARFARADGWFCKRDGIAAFVEYVRQTLQSS